MASSITKKTVTYGLRWLNQPLRLRQSALVHLPLVQEEARKREQSGPLSNIGPAYVLRDVIKAAAARLQELETTDDELLKALRFLRLYIEKPNMSSAARELGIGRTQIYNVIWPTAVELLVEQLQVEAGELPAN